MSYRCPAWPHLYAERLLRVSLANVPFGWWTPQKRLREEHANHGHGYIGSYLYSPRRFFELNWIHMACHDLSTEYTWFPDSGSLFFLGSLCSLSAQWIEHGDRTSLATLLANYNYAQVHSSSATWQYKTPHPHPFIDLFFHDWKPSRGTPLKKIIQDTISAPGAQTLSWARLRSPPCHWWHPWTNLLGSWLRRPQLPDPGLGQPINAKWINDHPNWRVGRVRPNCSHNYTSTTRASRGRKFQIWNAYSL